MYLSPGPGGMKKHIPLAKVNAGLISSGERSRELAIASSQRAQIKQSLINFMTTFVYSSKSLGVCTNLRTPSSIASRASVRIG